MNTREPLDLVNEQDGFIWPAADRDCRKFVVGWMSDLQQSVPLCQNRRVAVQAGGNVGTWPLALSSMFETVYTFEPDPLNFYCLSRNCAQDNIIKFQAALGNEPGAVDMKRNHRNVGAHYVDGSGRLPIMLLDSLSLQNVDFLCLDIEGYEYKAVLGARETIKRCRPIIHLEDKGLSEKYGVDKGCVIKYLEQHMFYEVIAEVHRDFVLAPKEML